MNSKINNLLKQLIKRKKLLEADEFDISNLNDREKAEYAHIKDRFFSPEIANKFIHNQRNNPLPKVQFPGDNQQPEQELPKEKALELINNYKTPIHIKKSLMKHSDPEVKSALALSDTTEPDDLLHLANNGYHEQVASNYMLGPHISNFEKAPDLFISAIPKLMNSNFFKENPEIANEFKQRVENSPNGRIAQYMVSLNQPIKPYIKQDDNELNANRVTTKLDSDEDWEKAIKNMFNHEDIQNKLKNRNILYC